MRTKSFHISLIFALCAILRFCDAQTILQKKSRIDIQNSFVDVWGYQDPNSLMEFAVTGYDSSYYDVLGNQILRRGIALIDVSDPSNPVIFSSLDSVPTFDIKYWNGYLYAVSAGPGGLIIDVNDPSLPHVAGFLTGGHNIFIDDKGYLYQNDGKTCIYDLNVDPINPPIIWCESEAMSKTHSFHDFLVKDDILLGFYGNGFSYYDIQDRTNPVLKFTIYDPSISYYHSGDISDDHNFLFICDELADSAAPDLIVWDIQDHSNVSKIGTFTDTTAIIHNFYVFGDHAICSYYTRGIRVFDITVPSQPFILNEYDTSPASGQVFDGNFGVFPFTGKNLIYANDADSGFYVFQSDIIQSVYSSYEGQDYNQIVSQNPTSGLIQFDKVGDFQLYNSFGQFLGLYSQTKTIDIQKFAAGIYFVVEGNSNTHKIVKNAVK